MSAAKKLTGDRKKVYKALVHLKKTDKRSYRRALKSVTGGPVKNPPASDEEIAQLVERLEMTKIRAAAKSEEIKGALEEMKSATPQHRVELIRKRYEAGRKKKSLERDIERLVREISIKTAEAKGKIVDQKADKIADLSIRANEASDQISGLDAQIAKIKRSPKAREDGERLYALYQKRENVQRISENIVRQQQSLARGMRRELMKAEFAANDELEKAGVQEPGAARLLADRVETLTRMRSAPASERSQLQAQIKRIDEQLDRVSKIYSGHMSTNALRDLSSAYVDLGPGVSRQIALRKKLEDAARGTRRQEELIQIRKRLAQVNQDLGDAVLDGQTKAELERRKKILEEMREERRFETRVLELVKEAIDRKEGREEDEKKKRYAPADKELYAIAKQIIEELTETSKVIGRHYTNCLSAMDTMYEIIAGKGEKFWSKSERRAIRALREQKNRELQLIKDEIESLKKSHIFSRVLRYGGVKQDLRENFGRVMDMYFGMTPRAMRVISGKKSARGSDESDLKKIFGAGRNRLGAAYIYGIMLYLDQVPTFDEEKLPKHMQGGIFVYPPLTHSFAGIQEGYLGIRATRTKKFMRGADLLPPFSLREAYQTAYDNAVKERMWKEAKGADRRAQIAQNFIRSGMNDFKSLAIINEEGKFTRNDELNEQEKASRGLYYEIHNAAQSIGLVAAEEEAERRGLEWRLPQPGRVAGQRLKGYKEFEGYEIEYTKRTAGAWITALKKNKRTATVHIYTELLGGEMLGDLAEATRGGAFGSEATSAVDYFGLGAFAEQKDFTFTDVYLRPPIKDGSVWFISKPSGEPLMCNYLEKGQESDKDVRRETIFAVKALAAAQSKRSLDLETFYWILDTKPWMAPELAGRLKLDVKKVTQEDVDELTKYVEGLTEESPVSGRLIKDRDFPRNFVYGELQALNKEIASYARSALDRADEGLPKLRAESDLKRAETDYAQTRGLNEFANRLKIQACQVTAGAPYWIYVLRDIETKKPLAMGYARDKAGATKMARKRDQLISEIWNSRDGRTTLSYNDLPEKQRRLLAESTRRMGEYQPIYFSPEIFNALAPTKEAIEEMGDSTYKKLLSKSAIFSAVGDIKETGVKAFTEESGAMLPQSKGKISSYETEDDEANYTIEVKAVQPGKQYEVRAVFHEIDEKGDIVKKPTPWVGAIDMSIGSLKKTASRLAKRYSRSISKGELQKNPALCKCIITGEYMAGVRKGSESFIAEYEKNPKKTLSKYTRKKNPAGDVTDIFEGAEFAEATQSIPDSPRDAYRIGYSEGIIAGLDLCGVKNYFTRRRLKRDYERAILQARKRMREQRTGIRLGKQVAAPVVEQVEEGGGEDPFSGY